MGAGSSTVTNMSTTYKLNDGNITVNGPGQRLGSAVSTASTDVKPNTQLSYSEDINLSWTGALNNLLRGSRDVLRGTVGTNTQLVQTIKAIGGAALRVSAGDSDFRRETMNIVNGLLVKSLSNGANGVIDSSSQITTEDISNMINLQTGIVDRMRVAGDAYHTVALGMTGMRNNEVATAPTNQSLLALKGRASEDELSRETEIMEIAGPRVGIMPRNKSTPEPDLIKNSIENAQTSYGRLGDIRNRADEVTDDLMNLNFSLLHARANLLSTGGVLRASHWETSQFVGIVNQITTGFTAEAFPGGHKIKAEDYMERALDIKMLWADTNEELTTHERLCPTAYAYDLAGYDLSRDVRLILNGSIVIRNQQKSETPIRLAIGYVKSLDPPFTLYFNKAVFINIDEGSNQAHMSVNGNVKSSKGFTNVLEDVNRHHVTAGTVGRIDGSILNFESNVELVGDETFSYVSQYSVAVNLSMVESYNWNLFYINKPVRAVLFVIAPNTEMSIEVQTPIIETAIILRPEAMSLIGQRYDGTVLDLLGEIDDWYSSIDPHDPIAIYEKTLMPLILKSTTIARYHVKDGAAYSLTVSHVKLARTESGLPQLTEEDMEAHVIHLITWIARWLYKGGPVGIYAKSVRKFLFMRLIENVMYHSIGHIEIFADKVSQFTGSYLKDCNDYNIKEQQFDRAVVSNMRK